MSITLTRLDPTGSDRTALTDFLASNEWPFHVGTRPSRDEIARAIQSGRYRDDENDTLWVDHDVQGRIGIVRCEDLPDSPMLDLRLRESARGHGLGVGVLREATRHVFTAYPDVTRIEATTRQDNIAMRKSFERCGWVKECHYRQAWPAADGRLLDSVGYAVLRDDFESGRTTPVCWNDLG